MTTPLVFAKKALLELNGNKLSDHNRSDLGISNTTIETAKRMANGKMRKWVVADKRTFSVSWDDLPHIAAYTVDGFWGGKDMENFFYANKGAITLRINNGDGTFADFSVFMNNFGKSVKKRGLYEFWDVDLELEEI